MGRTVPDAVAIMTAKRAVAKSPHNIARMLLI